MQRLITFTPPPSMHIHCNFIFSKYFSNSVVTMLLVGFMPDIIFWSCPFLQHNSKLKMKIFESYYDIVKFKYLYTFQIFLNKRIIQQVNTIHLIYYVDIQDPSYPDKVGQACSESPKRIGNGHDSGHFVTQLSSSQSACHF